MTHLIEVDSTSFRFGILTVLEYPHAGYKEEGVLTILKLDDKGFIIPLDEFDYKHTGSMELNQKIIDAARVKCEELGVQLNRY
jgi:hypothetical protein